MYVKLKEKKIEQHVKRKFIYVIKYFDMQTKTSSSHLTLNSIQLNVNVVNLFPDTSHNYSNQQQQVLCTINVFMGFPLPFRIVPICARAGNVQRRHKK
jgi:hypothetical protein